MCYWKDQDHLEPTPAEAECGKGDTATYLVQIFDQPHQITVLKVPRALCINLSIKDVTELIVKLGWGPVETIELLQDRGNG
jgi:hypothetical protein